MARAAAPAARTTASRRPTKFLMTPSQSSTVSINIYERLVESEVTKITKTPIAFAMNQPACGVAGRVLLPIYCATADELREEVMRRLIYEGGSPQLTRTNFCSERSSWSGLVPKRIGQ